MPWGAAIAVAGQVAQGSAAEDAEDAQNAATRDANARLDRENALIRSDNEPYREDGYVAERALMDLMGLPAWNRPTRNAGTFDGEAYLRENPDVAASPQFAANPYSHWAQYGKNEGRTFTLTPGQDPNQQAAPAQPGNALLALTQSPGYQFRLNEGRKALEGSAAARGGLFSGQMMRELERYGQGFASNEYDAQYNRLANIAGRGQTALGATASSGLSTAGMVGGNLMGMGNARGASYIAQGNALSNGINQGLSAWDRYRQNNRGNGLGTNSGNGVTYRYSDPYQQGGYYGGMEGE